MVDGYGGKLFAIFIKVFFYVDSVCNMEIHSFEKKLSADGSCAIMAFPPFITGLVSIVMKFFVNRFIDKVSFQGSFQQL